MHTLGNKLFKSHRDCYIPALRIYTKLVSTSRYLPPLSRFINKYLYKFGLGSALNRYDNSMTIYYSGFDKKLYKEYKANEIFCNFGSGAFYHNRWKNYDYPGQSKFYKSIQGSENVDFYPIDLCVKDLHIPENDNSVSLIYCAHTLEHLEKDSGKKFLEECYRILAPDGVMRVALPNTTNDFKFVTHLKLQEDDESNVLNAFKRKAANHILTDTKNLTDNEINKLLEISEYNAKNFYDLASQKKTATVFDGNDPGRHITFWDYIELISLTKDIGFDKCIPFYQGSSYAEPFTNIIVFDTTEPHIAFYADIIK